MVRSSTTVLKASPLVSKPLLTTTERVSTRLRVLPSWRETDDPRGPTSPLWPRLFSWLKGPSLPGPLEGTGEKEPLSTRLEPLSWVGGGRRGFLPLPLFFITPDLRGRVLLSPGTGPGPATGAWACSAAGVVEKAPRLVKKVQVLGVFRSRKFKASKRVRSSVGSVAGSPGPPVRDRRPVGPGPLGI